MDPITQQTALASAGGKKDPVYVDDVFSCDLWTGNSTTQAITNGIDLSGEGGLVWIKNREDTFAHHLFDTENGAGNELSTNSTGAHDSDNQVSSQKDLYQFNSNGYSIGQNYNSYINRNGDDHVGWTFRKCPGFFDVVTFTSNNSPGGVIVSHSLGSTPGSIWVKSTSDSSTHWWVWHRSAPVDSSPPSGVPSGSLTTGKLDVSDSWGYSSNIINTVSSTSFVYGKNGAGYNNDTNTTFVAYIFAHDDQSFGDDEDQAIIKCGSFEGAANTTVNLGFEPQWIMVKRIDGAYNWNLYDNMRGLPGASGLNAEYLEPNTGTAENDHRSIFITSTGFKVNTSAAYNTDTHIYIAIRRPHKPPVAGTEVLANKLIAGSASTQTVAVSGAGVTDMTIIKNVTSNSFTWITGSRLLGKMAYKLSSFVEGQDSSFGTSVNVWDQMTGTELNFDGDINRNGFFYMHYQFTRKPGVFDVVGYQGTSGTQDVNHNLGVTPEMIWVKKHSEESYYSATVYSGATGSMNLGENYYRGYTGNNAVVHANVNASTFRVPSGNIDTNDNGEDMVAYLFASKPGISKVGTYSGTGSDVNVDCGFTNGARFVLVKRTDQNGDWYVFDTERGINSGNDSYMKINNDQVPVTNQDYIDPLNAGFTITSSAPADLNTSGGTYLFFAIA